MFKRTKSFSKQAKKFLKSKKGFFVDTGVMILISVVLGALVLGGLYTTFNGTIMPSVKSKVESMFNYSDGGGSPANQEPELEEKYTLDYANTAYSGMEKTSRMGCTVDINKFRKIFIDGQEVDSNGYAMENGNYAYFALKKSVLDTFAHGMHTLKVVFDDGYAEGEFEYIRSFYFTVMNNSEYAVTGSTFDDWLWQTIIDYDTNGIVWKVNGDDKIYVDKNHTKYLKGVTWGTKIEEGKVYNEISQ